MSKLLISFCNLLSPGITLGTYDFEAESLTALEPTTGSRAWHGVDGIARNEEGFWILPQVAWGGRSALVGLNCALENMFEANLSLTRDAHSLVPYQRGFLVTDTGRNRINYVEPNLASGTVTEDEIWVADDRDEDVTHLNSIAVLGNEIFITLFGPKPQSGWASAREGSVYNVSRGRVLTSGLCHPHSLVAHDDALYWLESRTARLHRWSRGDGHQVVREVHGYLRGLAIDDQHCYFAGSSERAVSRSTGQPLPTQDDPTLEARIWRLDRHSGRIAGYSLEAFGSEIFDLHLLETSPSLPPLRERFVI